MKCLNCDRPFVNRLAKNPQYCSQVCRREDLRGILSACKACGSDFSLKGVSGTYRPFCSRSCAVQDRKSLRANPITQKKHRQWAIKVKRRDNFRCQKCGSQFMLDAHHIKKRSLFPELKYDVSNGITLCRKCHRWVEEHPTEAERMGYVKTRTGGK